MCPKSACVPDLFDVDGIASTSFITADLLYSSGRSATPCLVVHLLVKGLATTNSETGGFSCQIF